MGETFADPWDGSLGNTAIEKRSWPWRLVSLCAITSLVLYALLLDATPGLSLSEPSYAGEVFSWVPQFTLRALLAAKESEGGGRHAAAAGRFAILVASLLTVYCVMLHVVAKKSSRSMEILVWLAGASFLLIQVTGPAMLSQDVFDYIVQGHVFARNLGTPAGGGIEPIPGDRFVGLLTTGYRPSPYGPLWNAIAAVLGWLGGERIGQTVLLFRSLAVIAGLGTAALIWACLRRTDPQRTAQGLVFFLWNPLVVLEAGQSGHNDLIMVLLLLTGIWMHLRGSRTLAVIAIGLSALVKIVSAPILILYVVLLLRHSSCGREHRRFVVWAVAGTALAAGVVLGIVRLGFGGQLLPLRRMEEVLKRIVSQDESNNNLHEVLFEWLRRGFGEEPESACVPVYFQGWWLTAPKPAVLRSGADPQSPSLATIPPETPLIVIAPQETEWVWVYSPAVGRKGYVHEKSVVMSTRPPAVDNDPIPARYERGPSAYASVARANAVLLVVSFGAFGAVMLLAMLRIADLETFATWSAGLMLAAIWLIDKNFWPPHVLWALAPAALVPARRTARLAAILSATVLSLYVTTGADMRIYTYRSLPAFLLPLVCFGLFALGQQLVERRRARFLSCS